MRPRLNSIFGVTGFGLWRHHQVNDCRAVVSCSRCGLADSGKFFAAITALIAVAHAGAITPLVGDALRFALVAAALKAISELFDELPVSLRGHSSCIHAEANDGCQVDGEMAFHGKHELL